jgi:hypothetical protein
MSLIALAIAVPTIVSAQSYSTGFENMTSNGASVNGQDGWVVLPTTAPAQWQVWNNSQVPFQTPYGSQFLFSTWQGGTGTGGDQGAGRAFTNANPGIGLVLQTKLFVPDGSWHTGRSVGIHFATAASATSVFAGLSIDGAGRVKFGTSYGEFYSTATSGAHLFASGRRADLVDRWLDLRLEVIQATGEVNYSISGLGTTGGASTITGSRTRSTATINHFFLAHMWASSSTENINAAWDNVSLNPVPEPATMAALALGVGAIAARRRRNKK